MTDQYVPIPDTYVYTHESGSVALVMKTTDPSKNPVYSWYDNNGTLIQGETGTKLDITNMDVSKIGFYYGVTQIPSSGDQAAQYINHVFQVGIVSVRLYVPMKHQILVKGGNFFIGVDANTTFNPTYDGHDQYMLEYQWHKDGVLLQDQASNKFTKEDAQVVDSGEYKCSVNLYDNDNKLISTTDTPNITITVKAEVPCTFKKYVHPLPVRDTSFMYIGWWVYDELKNAKTGNVDWYKNFSNTKYPATIESICAGLNAYGDVLLMESRNGYIYSARDFLVV